MIKIVNKRKHQKTPLDVAVHRGFPLGNPYDWRGSPLAAFQCASRAEAIALYKPWLDVQMKESQEVLDELRRIYRMAKSGDVNLVCYCDYPNEDCHARIVKEKIESYL